MYIEAKRPEKYHSWWLADCYKLNIKQSVMTISIFYKVKIINGETLECVSILQISGLDVFKKWQC